MRKKLRRPLKYSSQINVKIPEIAKQRKEFVDAHEDDLPLEIREAVIDVINRRFAKLTGQAAS